MYIYRYIHRRYICGNAYMCVCVYICIGREKQYDKCEQLANLGNILFFRVFYRLDFFFQKEIKNQLKVEGIIDP